jgi:hypothetical protein
MQITVLEESSNDEEQTEQFAVQELVDWCRENVGDAVECRPLSDEQSNTSPPPIPAVVIEWLTRLNDDDTIILITGYTETIRKAFLSDDKLLLPGVSVLQHFELLLSAHLRDRTTLPDTASITGLLTQISSDTLALSKPCRETSDDGYDYIVRTIVIPTLLRIIETVLVATNRLTPETLARIASLLFCFDQPRLNTLVLLPSLDRRDLMEDCAIPMNTISCVMEQERSATELSASHWKDELTVQAASSCWKAMAIHMKLYVAINEGASKMVCQELGWGTVATAVRAQFFAKDCQDNGTVAKPSRKLTYPLKLSAPLSSEPAYQKEYARIHAALFAVNRIESTTKQILSQLLPVCYALIDSSIPEFVALGSTALIMLLDSRQQQHDELHVGDWKEFEDTLFSVLEIAMKVSGHDPVAIRHVCLACSKACEVLPHRAKERRRFAYRCLEFISFRERHRADENGFLRGIITGGLVPLLNQAKQNAEAMEVGRFGLQVLLPLIRWEFGLPGRKLQVATLVAIINLMVAAYPIMPHHGGKIASYLMACWGHANRMLSESNNKQRIGEEEQNLCKMVLALSTHASALALVFCGEHARAIMTEIQETQFEPAMVEHAAEVEKCYQEQQACMRKQAGLANVETGQ